MDRLVPYAPTFQDINAYRQSVPVSVVVSGFFLDLVVVRKNHGKDGSSLRGRAQIGGIAKQGFERNFGFDFGDRTSGVDGNCFSYKGEVCGF